MGIADYFLNNFIMIYELLGLLIMLEISVHISERDRKLSLVIILMLAFESVLFYLEKWTQTFDKLSPARPMLTAALYSIYPSILIIEMLIFSPRRISGKKLFVILIPELISIPVFFTSNQTRLVCWFAEDNHYQGGTLPKWPYILFGFYLVVFLVNTVTLTRDYSRKNKFITIFLIIGPVLGVVYYIHFEYDRDYSELFATAILLSFIYKYINMARIDSLTSLLNRQSFYKDVQVKKALITGVVSADMNELKYINDHLGHEAGDEALKTISDILARNCGKKGIAYRMGGDEFVMLFFGATNEEALAQIEIIRQKLAETQYSCAFGYAEKKLLDSIDHALAEADRRMFEDKTAIKKARKEKGLPVHFRE